MVKTYDPLKSGILSARRGAQTRLSCFRWSLHYILTPLGGASSRALVATPSFSRPKWLRYAPVQRSAATISSRFALTVSRCADRGEER